MPVGLSVAVFADSDGLPAAQWVTVCAGGGDFDMVSLDAGIGACGSRCIHALHVARHCSPPERALISKMARELRGFG